MFAHSLRTSALFALFAGVAVLPSSASAQMSDSSAAVAPIAVPAPVADNAAVTSASGARIAPSGVTTKLQMAPVSLEQNSLAAGEGLGRNKAMMGVGVAAVVVGLIIGSDIGMLFVIGGALIGLVGLFRHLQ